MSQEVTVVCHHEYGNPEEVVRVERWELPSLTPDQILVKMKYFENRLYIYHTFLYFTNSYSEQSETPQIPFLSISNVLFGAFTKRIIFSNTMFFRKID